MPRLIKDAHSSLVANIALPNAANTVNTGAIDLGSNAPYPLNEKISVALITTQSTGANSKNINIRLQDSNESNANFTNIAVLAATVVAGNAANFPASTTNIPLPASVKRYIRASATGEANGGDSSDGVVSVQLRF
jgi:hypothetical protein